ncbi:VWA domain-containing protein [bacterium]|nr:VWA domain-containing protein [FCB group bacterium]MBL7191845.1 VWA domain-containing protein [bacterium]
MLFANPQAFLLLIPLIILLYLRYRRRNKKLQFPFPAFQPLEKIGVNRTSKLSYIPWILRVCALLLLIIVLARPQSMTSEREVSTEGIDIVLALDISTSMLAEDFQPQNRLGAAKVVAKEFIDGRISDRIGLVVFAGQSFTQCPLTLDYTMVKNFIDRIEAGMIEDGTAIGMALATSVNRLRESKAESKIIILLTDGQNNRGEIDPLTAAQLAAPMEVKIYTIGVGTEGLAPFPVRTARGIRYQNIKVNIDEDLLKQIADITGGAYFRATDENKLREIYGKIDKMTKSQIKVKEYRSYTEMFLPYLITALILLTLEIILHGTRLRRIP